MRKAAFDQLLTSQGIRKSCNLTGYPKSSHYYKPRQHTKPHRIDTVVLQSIEALALQYPSYGARRIRAMLRRTGTVVSRKKVYRIMKLANLVHKKSVRQHVIVKRLLTVPEAPNQLWQQDITYIWCGSDGWCYLFSILDCYTREWLSYTFSTQCSTDESILTLEKAVLDRFPSGIIPPGLAARSDGGPQYTSERFIESLKLFDIKHEVTGKNRPDQNAYIESFHKSIKQDCIWQHDFMTFQEADTVIKQFYHNYNYDRPHSSLKYMTPKEFYAAIGGTV